MPRDLLASVPGSLLKNRERESLGPRLGISGVLYCSVTKDYPLSKVPSPDTHTFGLISFIHSNFTPVSAHQSRKMALGTQECVGSSALKHWNHSVVSISLLTDQTVNLRAVETSIFIIARYSDGSTDSPLPNKNLASVATLVWRPL